MDAMRVRWVANGVVCASLLCFAATGNAATCTVNSASDDPAEASAKVTAVPPAAWSGANASTVTLRDCILAANLMTGATGQPTDALGNPVTTAQAVPAMTIDLSSLAGQTIFPTDTLPLIFNNVHVDGGNNDPVTIDGSDARRLFLVSGLPQAVVYANAVADPDGAQPITVSFSNLILTHGWARGGNSTSGAGMGAGGAMFVNKLANVVLDNVVFFNNAAAGGQGNDGGYGGGGMGAATCVTSCGLGKASGGGLGSPPGLYYGSGVGTSGTTFGAGGFGGQGLGQISVAQAFNSFFSVDPGSGGPGTRIGGGGNYSGNRNAGFGGGGGYITAPGSSLTATGGFGGGGGYVGPGYGKGGNGGFGGGGGRGSPGGDGGFGGGGAYGNAASGAGGVGGGNGAVGLGGSGGGAGFGGAVFVRAGGSLTIAGGGSGTMFSGNTTTPGDDGIGRYIGAAAGRGLFLMSGATTLVDISGTYLIGDNIADDSLATLPTGQSYTAGNGSGASLVKQGPGILKLAANDNTYSGTTTVHDGQLAIYGTLSASPVVIDGGLLTGFGYLRNVTLNAGGTLGPGNGLGAPSTLHATTLTWNGGGAMRFRLGDALASHTDHLALSGAMSKGSAGSYAFHFSPGTGTPVVGSYALIQSASTTFSAGDFSYDFTVTPPLGRVEGYFDVSGGNVQFVVTAVLMDALFADGFGSPSLR